VRRINMSVPDVFIRDDGRGFIVRKGGVDFDVWMVGNEEWAASVYLITGILGYGYTIMDAVNNALAKMKAKE